MLLITKQKDDQTKLAYIKTKHDFCVHCIDILLPVNIIVLCTCGPPEVVHRFIFLKSWMGPEYAEASAENHGM